jgi:hypothetical protein
VVRRPHAVVVALGVLLGTAGCLLGAAGCDGTPEPGADAPTPTVTAPARVTPPTGTATLSEDTRAACAQATRLRTAFGKTFIADLKAQQDAATKGAQAQTAAKRHLAQHVTDYSQALVGLAGKTDDAALKKTLTLMGSQVPALRDDLTKIDVQEFSALTAALAKACGQG